MTQNQTSIENSENPENHNNQSLKQQCEEISKSLDKYNQDVLGIPESHKTKAPEVLFQEIGDIRKLTPNEVTEAVYQIYQYTFYLRGKVNRERVWQRWGKAKLDELVADVISDTDPSLGWNGRMAKAKFAHPLAKSLNQFLRRVEANITDNEYKIEEIHRLAETLKDIKFSALARQKGDY